MLQKIVSCLKEMLHGGKKCLILGKNVSFANIVLSIKFLIAEEVFFTTCKSPEFFKLDQEELEIRFNRIQRRLRFQIVNLVNLFFQYCNQKLSFGSKIPRIFQALIEYRSDVLE